MLSRVSRATTSRTLVRFGSTAVKFDKSENLSHHQSPLSPPLPQEAELPETHISKLSNGITVASTENHSPISSLSIAIRAGSRFENQSTLGHSLILKNMAFEDTSKRTRIALTRIFENTGSNLQVELGRELLVIRAQFLRENIEDIASLISSIVTSPNFEFHRVERAKNAAITDVENQHPQTKILDILHKTAYRSGLGNLIHPSNILIEAATSQSVQNFASEVMKPNNIAIIGTGVSSSTLQDICNHEFGSLSETGKPESKTKYVGGETVIGTLDDQSRYIYAFESAGLNSQDKYATLVLQHILDGQTHVKGGNGASRLSQNAKGSECFSFQYSDSGLFGFYSHCPSAMQKALEELKKVSSSVSDAELVSGKSKAKLASLLGSESLNFSSSLLLSSYASQSEVVNYLEKVSASDVQRVATTILKSKPTIVSSFN